MSDEEEWMSSSEEEADFSVSEDEWLPGSSDKKRKGVGDDTMETESDLSEEESESEDETATDSGTPVKMTRKQATRRGVKTKKSPAGARKLFSKYKEVPETSSVSTSGTAVSLNDILKQYEYQGKKSNTSKIVEDDESSSSGDEHLVPADKINLNSTFFDAVPSTKPENPPDFDCNVGISKSDEDETEPEFTGFGDETINRSASKLVRTPEKTVDLRELQKFNQNLEAAKKQLKNFQSKSFKADQENVDVSQLLAMGEEKSPAKPKPSNKRKNDESGSDWEEVEGNKAKKFKQNNLFSYFKKSTPA